MSNNRPDTAEPCEWLSALADGECAADEVAAACAAWRRDDTVRARWHAYQLIGDVLRSEDLASTAGRDAAFLRRLSERLQQEPVVLAPVEPTVEAASADWRAVANGAPVPAAGASSRRRAWAAPLTMAAGFVAVTALWVGTLHNPAADPAAGTNGSILAWMSPQRAAEPGGLAQSLSAGPAEPAALTVDGTLLRDAELDRYLQAHHQFGGDATLAQPASFLRSATDAPAGR